MFFSVCLSICPRAFLVFFSSSSSSFYRGVSQKKWQNPKTHAHDKKNSKGGKTEKKERERHKNTRAHTRNIYIYIYIYARARTAIYIQSIIHRARAGLKLACFISQSTHRESCFRHTKDNPFFYISFWAFLGENDDARVVGVVVLR